MKFINIRFLVAAVLAFTTVAASAQTPQEVAAKQVGDFKQGSIKGLPGVLPLNRISLAALANAPDSQLHVITSGLRGDYTNMLKNSVGIFNEQIGGVTLKTLIPLLPTPSEMNAISKEQDQRKLPSWAKEEPISRTPEVVNGRYIQYPTPTRLARAEFTRNIYRAVQSDMRSANEYALILSAKPVRKQLPGFQGVTANGELTISWSEVFEGSRDVTKIPHLDDDAKVAKCMPVLPRNMASVSEAFIGKGDADVVCILFSNLRGIGIPVAINIRDMNQFKETDELRLAIVFTLAQAPLATIKNMNDLASDLHSISIIEAKASYLQIIEVNSMQALGPKISLKSPDLSYLNGKDCVFALNRGLGMKAEIAAPKCLASTVASVAQPRN